MIEVESNGNRDDGGLLAASFMKINGRKIKVPPSGGSEPGFFIVAFDYDKGLLINIYCEKCFKSKQPFLNYLILATLLLR